MKILIVDDDGTIRHLVSVILKKEGHDVRTATSGAEALALLESEQDVELVMTDLHMPGMSGVELCSAVRNHEALSVTPAFLLLTATQANEENDAASAELAEAVEVGFDAVVPKQINRAGLLKSVNSLKTRSRQMMARKQLVSAGAATVTPSAASPR